MLSRHLYQKRALRLTVLSSLVAVAWLGLHFFSSYALSNWAFTLAITLAEVGTLFWHALSERDPERSTERFREGKRIGAALGIFMGIMGIAFPNLFMANGKFFLINGLSLILSLILFSILASILAENGLFSDREQGSSPDYSFVALRSLLEKLKLNPAPTKQECEAILENYLKQEHTTLDLSDRGLTDHEVGEIWYLASKERGMQIWPKLQKLDLSNNHLSDLGLNYLHSIFVEDSLSTSLTTLNISGNRIRNPRSLARKALTPLEEGRASLEIDISRNLLPIPESKHKPSFAESTAQEVFFIDDKPSLEPQKAKEGGTSAPDVKNGLRFITHAISPSNQTSITTPSYLQPSRNLNSTQAIIGLLCPKSHQHTALVMERLNPHTGQHELVRHDFQGEANNIGKVNTDVDSLADEFSRDKPIHTSHYIRTWTVGAGTANKLNTQIDAAKNQNFKYARLGAYSPFRDANTYNCLTFWTQNMLKDVLKPQELKPQDVPDTWIPSVASDGPIWL